MKKVIIFLILISSNFLYVYANTKEEVSLIRCVDGDTAIFNINGKSTRVRFLGIDTPESVKPDTAIQNYGKDASEYTCNMLTKATHILLEFDNASDFKDKYDRILAWIWTDDKLLQEELVSLGYAKVKYVYNNYSYIDLLYEKENIAKNNKIGIWSDYIPKTHLVTFIDGDNKTEIKVNENEKVENRILNKDGYKFIGWFYNNQIFDFNTRINNDIILYAKYEKDINKLDIILIIVLLLIIYLLKNIKISSKRKVSKYGK